MRIKQTHISNSINAFKNQYINKFDLFEGEDISVPVVFFGMYSDADYEMFKRWQNKVVIVWCGTDSLMITPGRAAILKRVKATHIVKSQFCSDDLKKFGIPHKIIPISWQEQNIEPRPLGDCIYHYGNSNAYGNHLLDEIAKKTGLHIYKTDYKTFNKKDLLKIYEKCFIGLRLTKHDGLPNTVLELGLMGRRCIYNGGIPNSISWKGIDDICDNIKLEYACRHENNTVEVAKEVKEFINIGDKWLEV